MSDEKAPMTVQEAGRLGGKANLAKHGREHFVAMGRKGGAKVAAERGTDYYKAIGSAGGNAVKAKDPEHFRRIGRLGGEKVKEAMAALKAQKDGGK